MSPKQGYALDLLSPVRHVATKLEEVRPSGRPLPCQTLAADYRALGADLGRVRLHEKLDSDQAATEFLIERAVQELGKQIEKTADGYRLLKEFTELRYKGRRLHPDRDDSGIYRDPFNPLTGGPFVQLRHNTGKDKMEELRASMKAFGWLPHHPAIQDERGVTLVGNRRLAVAAELGIDPLIERVRLGTGDVADAARFRLAIGSNEGAKPLTPVDREKIARHLYDEEGWSMERIGEALNVSAMTVHRDLGGLTSVKPKSRGGRPRKAVVEERIKVIEPLVAKGMTEAEVIKATGLDRYQVQRTFLIAKTRLDAQREARPEGAELCTCETCGNQHARKSPA